jgi:glycosyltransferase involved in cell wall biosynthesis
MKILIATPTFPQNKDGVAEAAAATATAFLSQGWKVEIATEPTNPARSSSIWNGAHIYEFAIHGSPYFRHPFGGQTSDYKEFLLAGDWDVILFEGYSWPLYCAVSLLDRISAKKIVAGHNYGALQWTPVSRFPYGLAVWADAVWRSLVMLTWIRKIDRCVFLSPHADLLAFYDHWLAKRARHPGITIIPNGVEMPGNLLSSSTFRQKHGIPAKAIFFLCIANYCARKDQGYAVRAFHHAAIPNSHLVFIGSEFNDSSNFFQQQDVNFATSSPPGTVHWLEKISRSETLDALSDCDVVVLSANQEALPFVLLEAMAYQKAWVARRAGCIQHLPGGICVHSEKQMAKAMQLMASQPDQKKCLGLEGRISVENHFSRKQYAKRYCDLVRDVVDVSS